MALKTKFSIRCANCGKAFLVSGNFVGGFGTAVKCCDAVCYDMLRRTKIMAMLAGPNTEVFSGDSKQVDSKQGDVKQDNLQRPQGK